MKIATQQCVTGKGPVVPITRLTSSSTHGPVLFKIGPHSRSY